MDITFKDVSYRYQDGTPMAVAALTGINLTIKSGSYTAIVGHTGSGKSTMVSHMNALLKPSEGTVTVGDHVITPQTTNKDLKPLREHVGMVFQFPENQLFAETVGKDIAFGPQNFGVPLEEAEVRAHEMLKTVGLPDELFDRPPYELSGGQMRRVAIAGVLAMRPDVLILDEPTAGLDPRGRSEMMTMFKQLHSEQGITVILITHQMDDVANFADHVIVVEDGRIQKDGTPKEIFNDPQWLFDHHLGVPTATQFALDLHQQGWQPNELPLTVDELADQLASDLAGKGGDQHG